MGNILATARRPRAGRGAARCGAGSTVRERRSSLNLRLLQHPLTRTRQDASAADSPAAPAAREYAQGAPGTERPHGPETASNATEGEQEKGISGSRTVMTRK